MPAPGEEKRLADRLRDNDAATWDAVETQVLPRVVAALQGLFGPGWRWLDPEGVARSAQRTACRRLKEYGDPQLETLSDLQQFENWLVRTAELKYRNVLRKAATERKHAPDLQRELQSQADEELAQRSADEFVTEFRDCLATSEEQTILQGKLAGRNEAALAAELRCSHRHVRRVWQRIRQRLQRYQDELTS